MPRSPDFPRLADVVVGHDRLARVLSDNTLFVALSAMNRVRHFKLVFLVLHPLAVSLSQEARRVFERDVASVAAKFDFLGSPPIVRTAPPSPFPLSRMKSPPRF